MGTPVARRLTVDLPHGLVLVEAQVSHRMMVVRYLASVKGPSLAGDLALLQELLRVQRVQRPQVVDHRHQLLKDGGLVGVLGQEDAAQDHLQLVLHPLKQFGVSKPGTV